MLMWCFRSYRQHITLTGILYLHDISECRMRGSSLRNLEMFEALCGKNALRNVIFTTTMWDKVPDDIGSMYETELVTEFWKQFMSRGCRKTRFRSTYESAWAIVDMFENPCALRLQEEMVEERPQTSASFVVLRWWKRIINKLRGKGDQQERKTS
jgi:hypothetical protein